jgi:NADH:ubiquinone oxidoreductase subunit K
MAVAAAEVAIGLGLIVAMARRHMLLDVDQASALRG